MTRKKRRALGFSSPDDLILKTAYIADQFGLSAADFERYRHLGLIAVTVGCFPGNQSGMSHIKCRLGNRVWEALVDDKGSVAHEATTFLRGKLARLTRADN